MIWSILLSLVYLYGCSGVPADKDLKSLLKSFEKDTNTSTKGVSIYFKELDGKVAGRCFPFIKIIQLNTAYYKQLDLASRKALVYHELGHCVCNLGHVEEDDSCGSSLMVPTMVGKWCYITKWNHYIKDLRNRCK
jgi:hypothetical protein